MCTVIVDMSVGNSFSKDVQLSESFSAQSL